MAVAAPPARGRLTPDGGVRAFLGRAAGFIVSSWEAVLDELEQELADLIVTSCRVAGPLPAGISPESPLIGPESVFGLDSLDAVEIVVAVQRKYNVRINAQETSRRVLQSLRTLAEFIRSRR